LKNKSILVDYLNFYTIFYIVFFKYKKVNLLYKHRYLNNLYSFICKKLSIKLHYLSIEYPSDNFECYKEIIKEKFFLIDQEFVGKDLLSNYLYKRYFYERIHPVVEIKVFFGHLRFDKVLINYGNYFNLLDKKDTFYNKVKYYSLPLLSFHEKKTWGRVVYIKKMRYFIRSYLVSIIKLMKFSLSFRKFSGSRVLVASEFNKSFINDSLYSLGKSGIEYMLIDPVSFNLYSSDEVKIKHLYSVNFLNFFQTIKGIFKINRAFANKQGMSLSLYLHILEKAKDVFFLSQIMKESDVKITFTCYEGSQLTNILNILGYESDDIVSLGTMWSLGTYPELIGNLYKSCDIFFTWGKRQNSSYLACGSPFKSLVTAGYPGDYAMNFMKNKPEDNLQKLRDKGNKIVAVYDNGVAVDGIFTYSQLNNFYKGVLGLLQEGSFACVIKSKKHFELSNYLDKKLLENLLIHKDKIIFNTERANLSPAFKSDYVYAFNFSSLGNVASIWGNKTIFYDEGRFINKNEVSKNSIIIMNYKDLLPNLKVLEKNSFFIDKDSHIDPFVDGNAQNRITEYMRLLLSFKDKSKSSMIKESNIVYKKKYGKDKIIENEVFL
jgi:hypothetical protein